MACAQVALADALENHIPTVFFGGTGGLTTYDSEMIKSQTSTTAVTYGFGTWAGGDRNIGIAVSIDTGSAAFETAEVPSGSVTTTWQDTLLRYRYGPVYFGAVIGTTTWVAERLTDPVDLTTEVEEYLNFSASGYGGNIGLGIPAGRKGYVYVDVVSLTPSALQKSALEGLGDEDATREVSVGSRLDIDLGGSFKLTKDMVDGVVGLKRRTVSVSVDGETFVELTTTTYLGFRLGWTF